MKKFGTVFNILSSLVYVNCQLAYVKEDSIILALENITKHLSDQNKSVSIVNFKKIPKIVNSPEPLPESKSFAFENAEIRTIYWTKNEPVVYGDNSIAIFDSFYDFEMRNFVPVRYKTFDLRDEQQFVYCENLSRENLIETLSGPNVIKHFHYFLSESKSEIELLTFVWYSPGHCKKPILVKINSFNKNTNLWENSKFKIEKFTNYFGCDILVVTSSYHHTYDYLMYSNNEQNREINCRGVWYETMKALSKSFNFTPKCLYETKIKIEKKSDYIEAKQDHFVKLIFKSFDDGFNHSNGNHIPFWQIMNEVRVKPYHLDGVYFAVPPGEQFNAYEKLYLPFDKYTWYILIFTFVSSFSTIFVVLCFAPSIKNYVFGENVSSPSLNVAAHFFGLGQNIVPKKSFTRFILMAFIIFSLIIRTAYQGKIY
jgi:hypothetical protein